MNPKISRIKSTGRRGIRLGFTRMSGEAATRGSLLSIPICFEETDADLMLNTEDRQMFP